MAPSSLLFFVSLVWATSWSASPILAIAAAVSAGVPDRCPSVPCGNLTISSPFGLFPVQASQNHCVRSFAFQVFCSSSNIPYLRYYDGGEGWSFQILDIFYDNSSLIVTDVDELQDFSSCHIPANNISKHVDPFSISAVNQKLIFYNCTKAPATIDSGLVQTRCGNNTFVRVGGPYGYNESGSYFIEGCDAITMPVLGDPAKTDASRYQELMSGGFLLTWQQPTSVGCCAPNMVQKRDTKDCQCAYPVRVEILLHNVSLSSNWSNEFLDEFASQLNLHSTQFEIINFYTFGDTGLNLTMDIVPQTGVSFSADEVTTMNNSLSLHKVWINPVLVGDYNLLNLAWFRPLAPAPGSNRTGITTALTDQRKKKNIKLILIVALPASVGLILTCPIWIMYRQKEKCISFNQKYTGNESNIEEILKAYDSLVPKRYKYSELKKITGSFKEKLGEGGYGTVFKGNLEDGRKVAVKLLKGSKGNGEEFLNELMSIRRTSHVNIVNLLGFCLHGSKRALIYEYMANGSLEKYIYSEETKRAIGWEKLREIAIGIARGLEYLHRGCNTRIIHFDIKPHNMLLDEDFCPKIADFGLAKLCHLKDSALSMAEARGTIGFIAPEVFSRGFGVVSTKSDVYSYGMLMLEMVGGRTNAKANIENSSEAYFPNWVYDRLVKDLQSHEVTCEAEDIARQMTLVGLWCIQTAPGNRPSMSRVIEMLEKNINELEMPPKPLLSCPSEPAYFSST